MIQNKHKYLLLPFIVVALIMALMLVKPVSADDGSTPEPTTIVETQSPDEVTTETAEVTSTPAPEEITETPAATETPMVTEAPTEEATEDSNELGTTLSDVVAAVSDNGIELVDENGDALPLVSRDTADTITQGDPYFTVGTNKYVFLPYGSDCSTATGAFYCEVATDTDDNPIQAALSYMSTNHLTPSDHKIYIAADTYTDDVVVDGTDPYQKTLTGLVGLGTTSSGVTITGSITVHDMTAGFSINNLTVKNTDDSNTTGIYIYNNTGTITLTDVNATASGEDSIGMYLKDTGNVVLTRVDASKNGYVGTWIETNGTVTINNSSFNGNLANFNDGNSAVDFGTTQKYGLYVYSSGPTTTLNGVTADDNKGSGASISNTHPITIKNSSFDSNNDTISTGDLSPSLIIYGAVVNMDGVSASDNGSATVAASGMVIQATSSLTASNMLIYNNTGLFGLFVYSCVSGPCSTVGKVTLKNTQVVNTDGSGISIYASGAVTLYDVTSSENATSGILIDNSSTYASIAAPVVMTLIEASDNEGGSGVEVQSRGAVTITNITANNNSSDGVLISTDGEGYTVLINFSTANTHAYNETSDNGSHGLEISSMGPVTVVSLNSNNNDNNGIYISVTSDLEKVYPVIIKVLDATAGNASYTGEQIGLEVYSTGSITVTNADASENTLQGAMLQSYGSFITVSNSTFNNNCTHNAEGDCVFASTGAEGLYADAHGLITLLNVSASGNDSYGVELINNYDGVTAGVTLNASAGIANAFSSNNLTGLSINTNGNVILTNVTASKNGDSGVIVSNDNTSVSGNVTFNATAGMGNNFLGNGSYGLKIDTDGSVTIANAVAINNGNFGLYIENNSGTMPVTIKQTGSWTYGDKGAVASGTIVRSNNGYGIYVLSNGAVSVAFYQAKDNQNTGIFIDADEGNGAVSITGLAGKFSSNVTGNDDSGIIVAAKGSITLNNIDSNNNISTGATLDNSTGTGSVAVTNGYFNDDATGLNITTTGVITWTNGTANNNTGTGAILNNSNASPAKTVTITNVTANDNGSTGLTINSVGAVKMTNVSANSNSVNGATIDYGDSYTDNLSEGQTWKFVRAGDDVVEIEVDSTDFVPVISVYDGSGNLIASGTASVEVASYNGLAGTYTITIESDDGSVGTYTIDLYNDFIDKGLGTSTVDNSAGIVVDNSAGTNAPVSLINSSVLESSNNSGDNVSITSGGSVTITNMNMNDSGSNGLEISGPTGSSTSKVILTNINTNDNVGSGVLSTNLGAIMVKAATANNNGSDGLSFTNDSGTVAVPVSLTNISASDNNGNGLLITTIGAVTILNSTTRNNISSGIDLSAKGAVIATNLVAMSNGNYGVSITTEGAVTINKPTSGYNTMEFNPNGGLYISTTGKVTITRVNASSNGYDTLGNSTGTAIGIQIDVTNTTGIAPVVLNDVFSDGNSNTGTQIETSGAVTVTLLDSDDNGYWGLYINQMSSPSNIYKVTLTRISADNNVADGINVECLGSIILSKFTANNNENNGVLLKNTYSDSVTDPDTGVVTTYTNSAPITILNPAGGKIYNQASGNGWGGMYIESDGIVNITGLIADENGYDGLDIWNNTSNYNVPVYVTNVIARNNGWVASQNFYGIYIDSLSLITIGNSLTSGNYTDGVHIFRESTNVYIYNTTSIGNGRCGFYIDLNDTGTLKFAYSNSIWFGNGVQNLAFYVASLILL